MTDRINKLRELFFANAHKAYRVEDLGLSILNEETEKLPFAIRKAKAFALAVEKMPLFLLEGDLLCAEKLYISCPLILRKMKLNGAITILSAVDITTSLTIPLISVRMNAVSA